MPLATRLQRIATPLVAAILAFSLGGCGNKDDKKVATQVAAKVGSEEISVHQINQVLSRLGTAGTTAQAAEATRREVLEKLIDQQLAVDKAIEYKLHRSPDVTAQIEAARRDILARAYIQQLAGGLSKPTPDEAKKYFVEHPQLFTERRVFNLQEILVPTTAGSLAEQQMRSMVTAGKSIEEMATWLKSQDIKFGGGAATRAAEQIPFELLTKVHALKDGQAMVTKNPQGLTVLRIASSQAAPVSEANALPRIEQFLTNQRSAETVTKTMKDLRAKTSITYMGDFAQSPGAAAPNLTGQAGKSAAPASVPVQGADTASTKSVIDKGVAALK